MCFTFQTFCVGVDIDILAMQLSCMKADVDYSLEGSARKYVSTVAIFHVIRKGSFDFLIYWKFSTLKKIVLLDF